MPRPRVTFSRNGRTSSGPSGPPKETRSSASYGPCTQGSSQAFGRAAPRLGDVDMACSPPAARPRTTDTSLAHTLKEAAMLDLRLVGVADDGSALLLGDDDGRSYRLAIDEAVGAAVRGDRSRIARQLQVEPGELRP